MKVTNGWLSGAVKKPISHNYTKGMWSKYPTWEGIVLHVTASEASSQYGWFNNPSARASAHLHVAYDGTIEQYVSLNDRSWTSGAGSDRFIGIETQGLGGGKWTDKQMAALTELCAFLSKHYGFPLTQMKDSKATSKGVGYHLLGVPNRTGNKTSRTGGELWSSVVKSCPGPERVKQVPEVIAKAKGTTTKTTKQVSTTAKTNWTGKMASPVKGRVSCEWRGYKNHSGIDIACAVNTPVYAAYGGKVEKQGTAVVAGRSGKGKVIRNPDGEAQYYGHLNSFVGKVGDTVVQGQLIGYSGATGNVTGPHLHFETWVKGGTGKYGQDTNPRVHFNSHRVTPGSTTGQKTKVAKKATKAAKSVAKGYSVKNTQKRLKAAGYYKGKLDGKDGTQTKAAVKAYQKGQKYFPGMKVDSIYGKMTHAHYKWVKKLQKKLNTLASTKRVGKTKVDGDYGAYVGRLVEIAQGATPAYRKKYKLDKIAGPAFCKAIKLAKHPYA